MEFAIVLPILLFVLFSMVDFGRYFYVRISLSSASFEVADAISRGLFLPNDDANTRKSKMVAIVNDVSPGIAGFAQLSSPANLTITMVPEACPNPLGSTSVKLTTTFTSLSPLFNFFQDANATSSMRCLR